MHSLTGHSNTSSLRVVKLGSSVLNGIVGIRKAAGKIAALASNGKSVVCVVSAIGTTTDKLFATINGLNPTPGAVDVASVLATGEDAAASLFNIAVNANGAHSTVARSDSFRLRTVGRRLDARPVDVDRGWVLETLRRFQIVVVPGFVGRCQKGLPTLLGRGGSDLSALFIAHALGAADCRLVKDVDGLYSWDPNDPTRPGAQQLQKASWGDAIRLGGRLVQSKAVQFARERNQTFWITSLDGDGTEVGPGPSLAECA